MVTAMQIVFEQTEQNIFFCCLNNK